MPTTQTDRALAFRALHESQQTFVIPNPWDAGSAKMLAALGFPALATTSAGFAFSIGRPDGANAISRDETLQNVRTIVEATPLPVSADLENGFGDEPEACAETILRAAEAGLVGGSIEDATGRPGDPIYPLPLAVRRIEAAARAARSLPFPFTLTARAENHLNGVNDLADTIRRLQAYAEAGADVLYAPGLRNLADVREVAGAVSRPLNVVTGWLDPDITASQLGEAGAKRISVGGALSRLALAALLDAGRAMREQGSFAWMRDMLGFGEMQRLLAEGAGLSRS